MIISLALLFAPAIPAFPIRTSSKSDAINAITIVLSAHHESNEIWNIIPVFSSESAIPLLGGKLFRQVR
jgi:hypothetical protein